MQRTLETCHGAITGAIDAVGTSLELFFNTETVSVQKDAVTRREWRRGTYFVLQYQHNKRRFSVIDGGVISAWRMCQHAIATSYARFLKVEDDRCQRSIERYQRLSNDLLSRMHTIDTIFGEVERVLDLPVLTSEQAWRTAVYALVTIKDRPYVERGRELARTMLEHAEEPKDLLALRNLLVTLRTIQTLAMNIISPISFALHEKRTETYDTIRVEVGMRRAKLLHDLKHVSLHEDFAVRAQLMEMGRRLKERATLHAIQCTAEQAMRLLAS